MKICIIRHGYFPSDPRVRKESEALLEEGHEVDVVCLRKRGEKSRDRVCGVKVYRIPLEHHRGGALRYIVEYAVSFGLFSVGLLFLHLRKRYDAIQVNTIPDFLVFTTIFPKLFGAKILLDIHDVMPELFRSKFSVSGNHPVVKGLALEECLSMKYADYVFVACERFLNLHLKRGVAVSKTTIIHNVPKDDLFDCRKYPERRRDKEEFLVISHGTILERYGLHVLINAVNCVKDVVPEVKALIVGEGEYFDRLKCLVKRNDLDKQVCLVGRVPFEEMPRIISVVDVGVVPLLRDEFTAMIAPNKLFEYVAMKKPVIATRLEGIQDYFDDSCVLFFESGDEKDLARCLLKLYQDPRYGEMLVDNAWKRYERIRWAVTKKNYQSVFERIRPHESN